MLRNPDYQPLVAAPTTSLPGRPEAPLDPCGSAGGRLSTGARNRPVGDRTFVAFP